LQRGNYTEADAAELTHAIVEAIAYLHEKGIAHRDLVSHLQCVFLLFSFVFLLQKPENLLLKHRGTATEVKIADFGLSRMVNEAAMMKTA
jgi:serine/threonine protein kinase